MNYTLTNGNIGDLRVEELYNYSERKRTNIFKTFLAWCEAQERDNYLWLALTFFAQIGLTLPLAAVFIVFFGGNNLLLWIVMATVNVPVLVLTLGAFPTKVRLPFVFFGWLVQTLIIIYCVGFALMH